MTLYDEYVAANVCYVCGDDLPGPARRDSVCRLCMEEQQEKAGYCRHGKWVGGSGVDHMCFWCEEGEDPPPPMPRQDLFVFGRGISIVLPNMDWIASQQWSSGLNRGGMTTRCVRRSQ